jgi:uncharacterized membrane protein
MSVVVTLFPEFFYLRDLFGSRINTIFKFYYQAWIMSAIAGAFVVYYLYTRLGLAARAAFVVLAVAAIGLGLVYPAIAGPSKLKDYGGAPTLDGLATRFGDSPDLAGIAWLNANVRGQPVVLEAPGQSYQESSRISAFTGLPTVIGWSGHEDQWRGQKDAPVFEGTRAADTDTIYTTRDWATAAALLDRYDVQYVYIGPIERDRYKQAVGPALDKFKAHWALVYQSADGLVTIYERTGPREAQ